MSEPAEFEIDAGVVVEAIAVGESPIVATLAARDDVVAQLRQCFSTLNAACDAIEIRQTVSGSLGAFQSASTI